MPLTCCLLCRSPAPLSLAGKIGGTASMAIHGLTAEGKSVRATNMGAPREGGRAARGQAVERWAAAALAAKR